MLQKGLLKESFFAEGLIAELRKYTRGYERLCSHESRMVQSIERQLIKCNLRITSFATLDTYLRLGLIEASNRIEMIEKFIEYLSVQEEEEFADLGLSASDIKYSEKLIASFEEEK